MPAPNKTVTLEINSLEIAQLVTLLTENKRVAADRLSKTTKSGKVRMYSHQVETLDKVLGQLEGQAHSVFFTKLEETEPVNEEDLEPEPDLGSAQRREFLAAHVFHDGVLRVNKSVGKKFQTLGLAVPPDETKGQVSYRLTETGRKVAEGLVKKDIELARARRMAQ